MKKKSLVIILSLLLFIVWFVYFLKDQADFMEKAWNDSGTKNTSNIPKDYLRLLANERMLFTGSVEGKWRNPISSFEYNSHYFVEIHKIDSNCTKSLARLIKTDYSDQHITYNKIYNDVLQYPFYISYKEGRVNKPEKIFLTLFGKKTLLIRKNDSVLYYYSNFNNFSITYNNRNYAQEIFSHTLNDEFYPIEILFYKKKLNLYLIIMAEKRSFNELNTNTLYKMIISEK